jgi:hypothetical protein|tara:strand:+ start:593 stop:973 length:381 start_codon:yes stop_codon:yes gene_type:complete
MTIENQYQELLEQFPFLTLASYGNNEYVGIMQNQDNNVTSMYIYEQIKDSRLKKVFLQLGEEWWWETNRKIPINIIMGGRFRIFRESLVTFTNKDFEVLHGPSICLRDIMQKRVKRKNVQLIRKVS